MSTIPTNLATLEAALDAGQLFRPVGNGRYWQCRRNGATKTWKREPSRFLIPIKYGFRGYDVITAQTLSNYRIAPDRYAAEATP